MRERSGLMVACAMSVLACGGPSAADDGGLRDAGSDGGASIDAGAIDAALDAGSADADIALDAGPPPPSCDTPATGDRPPLADRTLEVFRADVAADCEGNLGYAWVESRGPSSDLERDIDVWFRVLPAGGGEPGPAVRITDDPGNAGSLRVAWSGSGWIVAWADAAGDPAPITCFSRCDFDAFFALLDPDGAIVRGPEVLAATDDVDSIASIAADPVTGAALIVLIRGSDRDGNGDPDHFEAIGRRMDGEGVLGAPVSVSAGGSVRNGVRVARASGAYWMTTTIAGVLTTVRWPDAALSPEPPVARTDAAFVSRIAAADDGRLALWFHHGDSLMVREQSVLLLDAAGAERARIGVTLGHGGDGPGIAWIGSRLFATDRVSGRVDLVELDPEGGPELARATFLTDALAGILNGIDMPRAGAAVVFEANHRFGQELVVVVP